MGASSNAWGTSRLFRYPLVLVWVGVLFLLPPLMAQPAPFPYRLVQRGEMAWLATGALGFGVARALPQPAALDAEQRIALTGEGLLQLDRPWANCYAPVHDLRSDFLLATAMGAAVGHWVPRVHLVKAMPIPKPVL